MQLVEQHIIRENDSRFQPLDNAAFASKNLYNAANYVLRQEFINNGRYISYPELQKQMQPVERAVALPRLMERAVALPRLMEAYKALPAKVAQQVLISLDKNWQSFLWLWLVINLRLGGIGRMEREESKISSLSNE